MRTCISQGKGRECMDNERYKVLLIEDDRIDQEAFQRFVKDEELPYDCTVAASVSEAISISPRIF